MSDLLKVSFGELQAAVQHIDTAVSTLNSNLSDLDSAAKPLVSTWVGAAQEAYQVRQAAWTRAAQDISSVLASIKSALQQSADQYAQTEKANTSLFS
jgi:WXG100 family type VII secretion target